MTKDGETPAKRNPKDPSRPRRKKARRACYACQRAHLTCGKPSTCIRLVLQMSCRLLTLRNTGDERPCNRCIKRGLAEHCHDGVRKKAKYLHDAPPDALLPGAAGTPSYTMQQTSAPMSAGHQHVSSDLQSMAQPTNFYHAQPTYANYGQTPASGVVNSPSTAQNSPDLNQFGNSQSSMLPTSYPAGSTQQITSNQDLSLIHI